MRAHRLRLDPTEAAPDMAAGGPLVLDGSDRLSLVEAGALELRLGLPGQAGTAVPLLVVPAGGLVLALGTAEHLVRAWPEPGTRLRPIDPRDGAGAALLPSLLPALETWITALARLDVSAAPPGQRLPEGEMTLPEAVLLRPREGVAWLEVLAGQLEDPDDAAPPVAPSEGGPGLAVLPAAGPGLRAIAGTRLRRLDPAALLADGRIWPALDRFHAACLARATVARRQEAALLATRLPQRERLEERGVVAALAALTGERPDAAADMAGVDPLQAAIACIARAQGLAPPGWSAAPPPAVPDRHRAVLATAEAARLRARRVRLEPGWWRRAEEPMLGFRAGDGTPLALLPGAAAQGRRRRGAMAAVAAEGGRRRSTTPGQRRRWSPSPTPSRPPFPTIRWALPNCCTSGCWAGAGNSPPSCSSPCWAGCSVWPRPSPPGCSSAASFPRMRTASWPRWWWRWGLGCYFN
ncbi:hypothetical protein [Roseicella aquatilis]|uniref:Uncharacterized protein n=1 Tax=Roseicella aquatilis TaxID=2527868 RepID=A0A4R4D4V6_9PROT|nr:hypothetical protein [Roseicella aquatilis]TCZ53899.1 hypothetical protein EXY23_24135 [Roseicella aquatilis]